MIERIWHSVVAFAVVGGLALFTVFVTSDKKVDGYYLSSSQASTVQQYCVFAHWTWHADERAACFTSATQALEFAHYANQIARKQDVSVPEVEAK